METAKKRSLKKKNRGHELAHAPASQVSAHKTDSAAQEDHGDVNRESQEQSLLQELRDAVRNATDEQRLRIKSLGIPPATFSRFTNGGGINFKWIANLASALRLRISLIDKTEQLQYHESRGVDNDILLPLLARATDQIQILTSHPGDRIVTFLGQILHAVDQTQSLRVTILTSHPDNRFSPIRAKQLRIPAEKYRSELISSLDLITLAFKSKPNCNLRVYRELPIQLWHRIDEMIYVCFPAFQRRSRENCVVGFPVKKPGVKETFLDHFEKLLAESEPYSSERG
jgi:hypothetical protein